MEALMEYYTAFTHSLCLTGSLVCFLLTLLQFDCGKKANRLWIDSNPGTESNMPRGLFVDVRCKPEPWGANWAKNRCHVFWRFGQKKIHKMLKNGSLYNYNHHLFTTSFMFSTQTCQRLLFPITNFLLRVLRVCIQPYMLLSQPYFFLFFFL